MFTKIRVNFVLISLGILCFVFTGLTATFYVSGREKEKFNREDILNAIIESPLSSNFSRSFYVEFSDGKIKNLDLDNSFFTEHEVIDLSNEILVSNNHNGSVSHIYYIVNQISPSEFQIAGIDRSIEIGNIQFYLLSLLFIEILILTLLGTFLWLVSKWIVSPLEESIQKQKQFISDASHELKTPLTIISASAEVLRDQVKDTSWIDSIEDQVTRLNELINQLISLSVLEESQDLLVKEDINLSHLVNLNLLPYEAVAYEKNKSLSLDIHPDIIVSGNKSVIKQLIGIFIDNALKYSDETGVIKVTLINRKGPQLKFYNSGCDISPDKKDALFDRFYRADESRNSEKKGFGLGLSIAKKICDQYGYILTLEAKYKEYTSFTISF